jgi:hypothetical protein
VGTSQVTVLQQARHPGNGAQNSSHSTHQQCFLIVFVLHTTWQTVRWQGPQHPQPAQQSGAPQHAGSAEHSFKAQPPPAHAGWANARQAATVSDTPSILSITYSSFKGAPSLRRTG